MRTAVCISGQPREVLETWQSFVKKLLVNLPSPDVFIHSSQPYPVGEDYFNCIQPKKYVIEEQFPFPELEKTFQKIGWHAIWHANSDLQHIYGLKRVWEIKKAYEKETNAVYDLVVRIRPDFIFLKSIYMDFFEIDKINVFDEPDFMGIEFACGPNQTMSYYFTVFDWLEKFGEEYLLTHTKRNHGFYNCDLIMRACLLDYFNIPVRQILKRGRQISPYSYYQIMSRHKQGLY